MECLIFARIGACLQLEWAAYEGAFDIGFAKLTVL